MNSPHDTESFPVISSPPSSSVGRSRILLVGNPNAGKTSIFNALTGMRAKTANFPGTTVEHRRGQLLLDDQWLDVVDLPGLYSLEALSPDERVASDAIRQALTERQPPTAVVIVLDSTNLRRNLFLASQVLEFERPTVVAINMIDVARKRNIEVDVDQLAQSLGCPVVALSARTGEGMSELQSLVSDLLATQTTPQISPELAGCASCSGCQFSARYDWAASVHDASVQGEADAPDSFTEAIDRVMTHRVLGLFGFAGVMLLTFATIFWLAQYPMELIDGLFSLTSDAVSRWLPEGLLRSLITDGLIGGVGGMLVFLPQICLLFFILALLEDSGYMARAAFVMDRLMYRVGLPGKAFLPFLSAHACAIPAIMASRVIDDRRDRLATILVLPLMTCSARVPVYAMVMALLFPDQPLQAALLFAGAYALGIVTALVMAWVFKLTILPGRTRPLVIELPSYHMPSLRNALYSTWDRAAVFIRNAGTTILVISLVLWALATFPQAEITDFPQATQAAIEEASANDPDLVDAMFQRAQLEYSFAGRIGKAIEPLFAPLGFDWKTSIGVVSSFAAREVVVSTLAILYGLGDEGEGDSLYGAMQASTHADGSPVFTTATAMSLLVFYVLAMQCLPTQAVTKRETGTWKWPIFQLVYMTLLAYGAAFITHQVVSALA